MAREYLNSKSKLERVRDRKLIRIVHGEAKQFSPFTMIAHRNRERIVQITTGLSLKPTYLLSIIGVKFVVILSIGIWAVLLLSVAIC